ncbi:MAG: hypothetical protein H0U27_12025 [Nitrosopumilus sp.]|nr:hypothetical protein [Nitrosopumilus sp.]
MPKLEKHGLVHNLPPKNKHLFSTAGDKTEQIILYNGISPPIIEHPIITPEE